MAPYGRPWRLKSNWEVEADGEVEIGGEEAATLDWDLVRMLMPMLMTIIAQVPTVDSCLQLRLVGVNSDQGGGAE